MAKKQTKTRKQPTAELPKYRSSGGSQPDQAEAAPIKNSWQLSRQSVGLLVRHWKLFGWLALIYGLLELVLSKNAVNLNSESLKQAIGLEASGNSVGNSFQFYAASFSDVSFGAAGSAWSFVIAVLMSLVVIWCLRQILSDNNKPGLSDAFYKSTTPLVPFVLIILLISVQMIPMVIGFVMYSLMVQNGITVSALEQLFFFALMIAFAALSVYWLTRSVVSLYIVTLPGTKPLEALAEAKDLVDGRRWSVARKIIFLPVALFVAAAVLIVPVIMLYAPLAQALLFILSLLGLFLTHAYFYLMYRSLLGESDG